VHILPPRGSKDTPDTRLWRVDWLRKDNELGRVARLVELQPKQDTEPEIRDSVLVDDLVVVAQHNDTIYPGLVQTGEVIGTDDPTAPFHSVINAENYHALKMLTYTHYHSIDCIYIDPPYNTGAKDWKYNNDYVDGDDAYRHSKWLSFMERRLLVAKQLLNPDDSVLIVTIDEKEYLRLGMLLEQMFPEARVQMVSSVINPSGSSRMNMFSRSDEYIFFVFVGNAAVVPGSDDMLRPSTERKIRWDGLMRRGANGKRTARPNLFYPLHFSEMDGKFVSAGEPLAIGAERSEYVPPVGTFAVFPVSANGDEATWGLKTETFTQNHEKGYVRFGPWKPGDMKRAVYFLQSGTIKAIEDGSIETLGFDDEGAILTGTYGKPVRPMTTWTKQSHSAGDYGVGITKACLGGSKFTYPKSLYAVEDALRFFVKDKPDATVLDFFSGSGTTAHAVMRLNKQDGGRRRSISVTNNEVSADEQVKLRKQGLRPGDTEWEQWGICDYVTKPRVEAAITGRTPEGDPIKGDYKFTDEFPMSDGFEANARFFTLTYQPLTRVRHGYAFADIAPLLWMRAGQTGRIIETIPERGWDIAESYAIIENVAASTTFDEELSNHTGVNVVYIVTNDDLVFESMARELSNHDAELVRLYSTYLNNFAFQQNRETV